MLCHAQHNKPPPPLWLAAAGLCLLLAARLTGAPQAEGQETDEAVAAASPPPEASRAALDAAAANPAEAPGDGEPVAAPPPPKIPELTALAKAKAARKHSTALEKDFSDLMASFERLVPYLGNKDIPESQELLLALPLRSVLNCASHLKDPHAEQLMPVACCLLAPLKSSAKCMEPPRWPAQKPHSKDEDSDRR